MAKDLLEKENAELKQQLEEQQNVIMTEQDINKYFSQSGTTHF